jgi:hypothetical protein
MVPTNVSASPGSSEIAEIGAQKHVAALAVDALQEPGFERLGSHGGFSKALIYDSCILLIYSQ